MPPRRQQPREVAVMHDASESEAENTDVEVDGADGDEDNEDEDEDDDEDDDEEEEEVIEARVLPARSNRGNRMAELLSKTGQDEDASEFWQNNKEVFAEDEVDSDFEAAEEEDYIDEDFDQPELEDQQEDVETAAARADKEEAARERNQVRKAYVDPALKKKARPAEESDAGETAVPVKRQRRVYVSPLTVEERADRPQRKAAKAVEAAREIERERRAQRKTPTHRRMTVYHELTQEQQLEQARLTEIYNKSSLEELLNIEMQKKVTTRKPVHLGATVVTRTAIVGATKKDRAVEATVDFKYCMPFDYIQAAEKLTDRPPQPSVTNPELNVLLRRNYDTVPCVITGLPAKYRDRVTGLPFATPEALQQLREHAQNPQFNPDAFKGQLYTQVPVSMNTPTIQDAAPPPVHAHAPPVAKRGRGRKKAM